MKYWKIIDKGKTISKHKTFYLAQEATIRHQQNKKISIHFEIIPTKYKSGNEYLKSFE